VGIFELSRSTLHGENDFVALTKRFANMVPAKPNCCGDDFNRYNNNLNCHKKKKQLSPEQVKLLPQLF